MPLSKATNMGILSCLLPCAAPLAGGCGGTGYASATVSGRVTIDGAAVPKGFITFTPLQDTAGPAVGAPIVDGAYRCPMVPQGKLRATFIAIAAEPEIFIEKVGNVPHEVPKDILPAACRQGRECDVPRQRGED